MHHSKNTSFAGRCATTAWRLSPWGLALLSLGVAAQVKPKPASNRQAAAAPAAASAPLAQLPPPMVITWPQSAGKPPELGASPYVTVLPPTTAATPTASLAAAAQPQRASPLPPLPDTPAPEPYTPPATAQTPPAATPVLPPLPATAATGPALSNSSRSLGDTPAEASAPATVAPVRQGQRLALVIGNSAYTDAPLLNPLNDARAVAAALEGNGFQVILKLDANLKEMQNAVRDFGDRLRQGGGTGLFYFAGHGMQIKGRNQLIPVGADIQREDEVAYNSLDAQAVLDKMESAGNGTNLMILDACRNNPFARSFRSGQQGLAQMDAPVGTMVAFSTAPGSVSSDGTGSNGLYTEHLLRSLRTPGLKVEDVFKQVRAAVRRESQGKQIPWESTSLEGDFYFVPPSSTPVTTPVSLASPTPRADAEVDDAFWSAVSRLAQRSAIEAYLRRFPQGAHAPEALQRLLQMGAAADAAETAPAPARELPAHRNAYGFTEGDSWEYAVIDGWRDVRLGTYTVDVAEIGSDGALTTSNGGLLDSLGRWKKQPQLPGLGSRSFTPYLPVWWDGAFATASTKLTYQIKEGDGSSTKLYISEAEVEVGGLEPIQVPAGSFSAHRVKVTEYVKVMEGSSWRGTERWSTVYWYVPELHRHVAMEQTRRDGSNQTSKRFREELLSLSLAGSTQASR